MLHIRLSPACTPSQNLPKQSITQPSSSQFIIYHRSAPRLAALPRRIYLNKAAAGEDSLQIVKIVMIYFFTALTIEGHTRVPSLVDYALMRFNAFRMEVI